MNLMGGGLWGVGMCWPTCHPQARRFLATRCGGATSSVGPHQPDAVHRSKSWFTRARLAGVEANYGSLWALVFLIVYGAAWFGGLGRSSPAVPNDRDRLGLMNLVMLPMYILSGVFFSSSGSRADAAVYQAAALTAMNNALRGVMLEGKALRNCGRVTGAGRMGHRPVCGAAEDLPLALSDCRSPQSAWPNSNARPPSQLAAGRRFCVLAAERWAHFADEENPREPLN